jgi:hypothetical protein
MFKSKDNADASAREMAQLDEGERIRRWRRGMQAGEELQRRLRAAVGPRPAQAVAELFSVLHALEAMGRWPGPSDPLSEQGVQEVRERWARIQRRARAQALQQGEAPALEAAVARAVARLQAEVRRIARAALRDVQSKLGTAIAGSGSPPRRTRAAPTTAARQDHRSLRNVARR